MPALSVGDNLKLPDMGNTADYATSPVEEKRIGEAVIRNIRRGGGIVDDPLVENYLDHLGFRLVSNSNISEQHFKFYLVNDKGLNAYALPGGFIGINYGLIMETETEGELASVMSHEIAHITQRHHVRSFEHGSNQAPIIAAVIAAIILGVPSELGEAAVMATTAGIMESNISFTRANEKEADYIGINMLANAGYDPENMATFFTRLESSSRLHGSNIPEYLRTHPYSANRMADAQSRARLLKTKERQFDQLSFYLMQSRIRALSLSYQNKRQAVIAFEKRIKNKTYANLVAEEYGYALALTRAGEYQQAEKILDRLLHKDPNRIAYLIAKGQLENSMQKLSKSQTTYARALELYPDNKVIVYYYVQSLLKNQKFNQAREVLNKLLRTPNNQPQLYKFLSEAETGLNNPEGIHQALAEYHFYQGQPHEAIRQMQMAIKTSKNNDFYLNAKREARIKEYQKEIISKTPVQ